MLKNEIYNYYIKIFICKVGLFWTRYSQTLNIMGPLPASPSSFVGGACQGFTYCVNWIILKGLAALASSSVYNLLCSSFKCNILQFYSLLQFYRIISQFLNVLCTIFCNYITILCDINRDIAIILCWWQQYKLRNGLVFLGVFCIICIISTSSILHKSTFIIYYCLRFCIGLRYVDLAYNLLLKWIKELIFLTPLEIFWLVRLIT